MHPLAPAHAGAQPTLSSSVQLQQDSQLHSAQRNQTLGFCQSQTAPSLCTLRRVCITAGGRWQRVDSEIKLNSPMIGTRHCGHAAGWRTDRGKANSATIANKAHSSALDVFVDQPTSHEQASHPNHRARVAASRLIATQSNSSRGVARF